MARYRFRLTDARGNFVGTETRHCDSDLDALDYAKTFCVRHNVEIWDGKLRVARVKIDDAPMSVKDKESN